MDYRLARGPCFGEPGVGGASGRNVVAHGLQHLVHLLHSDPVVAAVFAETPAVVRRLRRLPSELVTAGLSPSG